MWLFLSKLRLRKLLLGTVILIAAMVGCSGKPLYGQGEGQAEATTESMVIEADFMADGIFTRAWRGGLVVFTVLLVLILMSIFSWAIVVAKLIHLARVKKSTLAFIKSFWDSRSLNDLNSRLNEYPYSPAREVFRTGYSELVRASQLRDQSAGSTLAFSAAIENLTRSLQKARLFERRRLESLLSFLAICASAAPFIGLFGTVWGIMGAFEGIARTGSASLAAVAPGISEALIATAFGLAAAIPAVIGYNMANARIRAQMTQVDGFSADFLNIVERYLVTDRSKAAAAGGQSPSPERL